MIGLAASPGTEVLPTCSIRTADSPSTGAIRLFNISNDACQCGPYGVTTTTRRRGRAVALSLFIPGVTFPAPAAPPLANASRPPRLDVSLDDTDMVVPSARAPAAVATHRANIRRAAPAREAGGC